MSWGLPAPTCHPAQGRNGVWLGRIPYGQSPFAKHHVFLFAKLDAKDPKRGPTLGRAELSGPAFVLRAASTFSNAPVDYPDFVRPAAEAVARGDFERGIVLGGSGNGEAIAANKVRGVRCSPVWAANITTPTFSPSGSARSPANLPCASWSFGWPPPSRAVDTWLEFGRLKIECGRLWQTAKEESYCFR